MIAIEEPQLDSDLAADNPSSSSEMREKSFSSQRLTTIGLTTLTFLAVTQALYVSTAVMLPIVAALVAALACRPIVRWMTNLRIPPMVGAGIVLSMAVLIVAFLATQLIKPAAEWAERAPIKFHMLRLQRKLEPVQQPLQDLSKAADELSTVTSDTVSADELDAIQQVVVKPPSLINEVLSSTTQFAAGAFLFLVLTYFFLAKGDVLVIRIAAVFDPGGQVGPHGDAAAAVEKSVSTYLMNVGTINAGLGVAVGLACWAVGVPNPMLWGAMAAVLNFLPYIGGLIGAAIVLGVSLLSFDSTAYAFVAPSVYLALTTIEGNFITPSVLGRSMSLNPLVVILSLTYWTWLWGLGGAILAVPLLAIITSLSRQFEATRGLALILSE